MHKILIVDDDRKLRQSLRLHLKRKYEVILAENGQDGLEKLKENTDTAVIISDLKMPVMDGIRFLNAAKNTNSDASRILLTGYADIDSAIKAVNSGQIFRFLTKPSTPSQVGIAVMAGVKQYNLIQSEKILLEKTLRKTVEMLVDIMAVVKPSVYIKVQHIRRYMQFLLDHLDLENSWEFEIAAMLSHLGVITVSDDIIEKIQHNISITDAERNQYMEHPEVACKMISEIPRLESVGQMIQASMNSQLDTETQNLNLLDRIELGAHLIHICVEFEKLHQTGMAPHDIISRFQKSNSVFHPKVVEALYGIDELSEEEEIKLVTMASVIPGMITMEKIYSKKDFLLINENQLITGIVFERLQAFSKRDGIQEPFRVRVKGKIRDGMAEGGSNG